MRIDVVTIFPRYLDALRESLPGRAIADGRVSLAVHDLRDWAADRHRTVDDTPYGGGPGMVMKPDVWGRALDSVVADAEEPPILVVPTPAGRPFTQAVAAELATAPHLVFACGRYEGIDQRVMVDAARRLPVREISIGDYVLNGGEVAVLVVLEAVLRLVPGVLGNPRSAGEDSFADHLGGLLEAPSYTRPAVYRDLPVPEVLLGGNHAAIDRFRRDESLRRTAAHRPDLLATAELDDRDRAVLAARISDPPGDLAD
ncbi:tRNA (guanosine(37)-N1)-methyltransferase TrmD [Nakamurella flava]|uniref:tRNA (guanine-N(1)-)-methyltransferase n=1 Tax=Nakamurella flava TaxID=2576308 RepID=A0A4U6QJX1_9ACTN|nr:tRNA (guanosine(37)-N1)-methyltransferase TrmD [Nakamurella flava]TKV60529.1 tRNA (guanosine(37)-N1)-methyltransferase TrmD [Nakamurella flava]